MGWFMFFEKSPSQDMHYIYIYYVYIYIIYTHTCVYIYTVYDLIITYSHNSSHSIPIISIHFGSGHGRPAESAPAWPWPSRRASPRAPPAVAGGWCWSHSARATRQPGGCGSGNSQELPGSWWDLWVQNGWEKMGIIKKIGDLYSV